MSIGYSINEYYFKERINDWYIDTYRNIIYGNALQFGFDMQVPVLGHIEGYIDKYIMARVNFKLYAFVPGNVREDKRHHRLKYFEYLERRAPKINIVI